MPRITHLVAVTSFVTGDGESVSQGEVVEADHPVVKGRESLFREWQPRQTPPAAKAENVKAARAAKAEEDQLTGDALNERAAELEIEGRSAMSADEKRAAVGEAEQ